MLEIEENKEKWEIPSDFEEESAEESSGDDEEDSEEDSEGDSEDGESGEDEQEATNATGKLGGSSAVRFASNRNGSAQGLTTMSLGFR